MSPYGAVGALATRALAAALDGRPRVASTFAERAAREAGTRGDRDEHPGRLRELRRALVALLDERPIDAERALRRALTILPAIECGALHAWLTVALAEISAARGRLHASPSARSPRRASCWRAAPTRAVP